MTVLEQTRTLIRLEADCDHEFCTEHAQRLYDQLSVPHYSLGASIMDCPSLEDWRADHRTARKRAARAKRFGFWFREVDYSDYADDIYEINVSLPERQGRPMSDGYTIRRSHRSLSETQTRCTRHRTHTYGIINDGHLRAYMTLHRAGELAMVSMILGHGDDLDDGIMFLLFEGVVDAQADEGGFFYYNLHRSGREGLRWMKERVGFRSTDLEWQL